MKPVDRKMAERALYHLCLGNSKTAKTWLEKALGLIEVKGEKKLRYTWRRN